VKVGRDLDTLLNEDSDSLLAPQLSLKIAKLEDYVLSRPFYTLFSVRS
jgi:hypothetical protein